MIEVVTICLSAQYWYSPSKTFQKKDLFQNPAGKEQHEGLHSSKDVSLEVRSLH